MTFGEKMVWATVFAEELNRDINPPEHILAADMAGDKEAWEQWEIDQAVSAAEVASSRVTRMRQALDEARAGFGEESDVFGRLYSMLRGRK